MLAQALHGVGRRAGVAGRREDAAEVACGGEGGEEAEVLVCGHLAAAIRVTVGQRGGCVLGRE